MDFPQSDICASTAPPLPPLYLLLLRPPSAFSPGGRSLTTGRQRSTPPVLLRARRLPCRPRPALLLPYGPQAVPKPKTPSDFAPPARLDGARSPPGFDGSLGGAACFDPFCPSHRTAQRPHRDSSEGCPRPLSAGARPCVHASSMSTLGRGAPPTLTPPPAWRRRFVHRAKSAALRYRTRYASVRPFPTLFSCARPSGAQRSKPSGFGSLDSWTACALPPPGQRAHGAGRGLYVHVLSTQVTCTWCCCLHTEAVPCRVRHTGASVHGTRARGRRCVASARSWRGQSRQQPGTVSIRMRQPAK